MNEDIRNLEPKSLWNHFCDLNAVPRPSKKEERVIAFIRAFGENLNLPTTVDEVGNVIIKKPATAGMENANPVVLQSHLDMVHQKNADTDFDFNTEGIKMKVEDDWVKAEGTTLGADNGIGVAAIMSLLASTDIPHPPLEALFTIDEETGMTGALALKGGLLDGHILLNLDTEEDNELTIGCAGGIDVTATGTYTKRTPAHTRAIRIFVKGLTGGHSGIDIHKGRANANKLMNRMLWVLAKDFGIEIAAVEGGSLRNAIPRESVADIAASETTLESVKKAISDFHKIVKQEYASTDPNLNVSFTDIDLMDAVLDGDFQKQLLGSLYACQNGIYRMSPDIKDLVQTSNNIARVEVKAGNYSIQCLTRSSVDTEKMDLAQSITALFEMMGAKIAYGGSYPGWIPRPDSPIVKLMSKLYREMYQGETWVNACHAGLECGILGTNYPEMQMISFGPTIHGAHSPDEKVKISSVQKFWNYLQATLKELGKN